MLAPEVEARPWAEQLALDDASYRAQLVYLFERSAFYREKLTAAGIDSAEHAGGLADIAGLPLTEKGQLKGTATAENPFGTHLAADPSEIVRIYSTSGTTGTPSYLPLTASDLENWITGSARSYAASGVVAGQRIVSTYNAGPFVAGVALTAFERIGLCHVPVGTGNTERLLLAIELLRPEAVVLTPSYAAYLVESALERGLDLRESSVERVLVAGEPGGGRGDLPRQARGRLGRKGHRGDGDRRHRPLAVGRVQEQDGMHLGARGFVHPELIDPGSGRPWSSRTAPPASLSLRTSATRPPAPELPHARPRGGEGRARARAAALARVRCVGRTDDMLTCAA